MRDFYDVYILGKQYEDDFNPVDVYTALIATAKKRGSDKVIQNGALILSEISKSPDMLRLWENYQKRYEYASEIAWRDVMDMVTDLYQSLLRK